MFDKWKIRQELCKAHKIYHKKTISFLHSVLYTFDEYQQLKEIEYAIAYALCEYFDFNYEFYYDYLPFSYKWYIAYDYIKYYDECKEAYEKFNHIQEFDLAKPLKGKITDKQYGIFHDGIFYYDYIATLIKGNVYFDIANNKQYIFDGKNLVEMC